MGLNPTVEVDRPLPDFAKRFDEFEPEGFRLLSLSMYGDPKAPLFAAVWDKRAGPKWKWKLARPVSEFKPVAGVQPADVQGFQPVLVTGTGGGSDATLSVVYEKIGGLQGAAQFVNALTVGQGLDDFRQEMIARAQDGWLPTSATIYDAGGVEPRISAVWKKNKTNVAWNVCVAESAGAHEAVLKAQSSAWFRLAFLTGSTGGRLLAIYRDDHIGAIGTGFVAHTGFASEAKFQEKRNAQLLKDFYTLCLQGYGSPPNRKYAAIFVNNETPVARKESVAGGPDVPDIDKAVFKLMKLSNIRGASLAIVKGSRLVLARGYTWAEPDYPPVTPATCFRLGSVSKLIGAVSIHQLAAEGKLALEAKLASVLPLTAPDGSAPTNAAYKSYNVRNLIEKTGQVKKEYFHPRYSNRTGDILDGPFKPKAKLPVTPEQVARFMLTVGTLPQDDKVIAGKVSDFGYFLAGELVKQFRGTKSLEAAMASRITEPLQIKTLRSARSRIVDQHDDEARFHPRELVADRATNELKLTLNASVMEPSTPPVPPDYGDDNLENLTYAGGLSASAPDIARVLAAMSLKPYTPLGRPVVDNLLAIASQEGGGHGFDKVDSSLPGVKGLVKGGRLTTAQAGVWFTEDDVSHVILWNGVHTGPSLVYDSKNDTWYGFWNEMLTASRAHVWAGKDRFPSFLMASLPKVEGDWRRCVKCQMLFFAAGGTGKCPAGAGHQLDDLRTYELMHRVKPELEAPTVVVSPYGQAGWRRCVKCRGLFLAEKRASKCPADGSHTQTAKDEYRLLMDSPYDEHEQNWRRCAKCGSLFLANKAPSVCKAGGSHDHAGSGNYRLAFTGTLKR